VPYFIGKRKSSSYVWRCVWMSYMPTTALMVPCRWQLPKTKTVHEPAPNHCQVISENYIHKQASKRADTRQKLRKSVLLVSRSLNSPPLILCHHPKYMKQNKNLLKYSIINLSRIRVLTSLLRSVRRLLATLSWG